MPYGEDTLVCTGTDSSIIRRRLSDFLTPTPAHAVPVRQRWLEVFRFERRHELPNIEPGYWNETMMEWSDHGLPADADTPARVNALFGLEQWHMAPIRLGLWPPLEPQVIRETDETRVVRDELGIVREELKGRDGIPHYVEFPITSADDLEALAPRLSPEAPGRFPDEAQWSRLRDHWRDRHEILGCHIGSFFGWLRNWMGFEEACIAFAISPELVIRYAELVEEMVIGVMERAFRQVEFDYALIWEDMAYKNGPMISPAMFERFCVPHYRTVTDLARRHGIEVVIVDTDGYADPLIDSFLAGGVNCLWPLEVAAGTDPIALRERYGERLLLLGGVDKRALLAGREAMKQELRRLRPVVESGGYIPHVDHKIPPGISMADFRYYIEAKRDILGCA